MRKEKYNQNVFCITFSLPPTLIQYNLQYSYLTFSLKGLVKANSMAIIYFQEQQFMYDSSLYPSRIFV